MYLACNTQKIIEGGLQGRTKLIHTQKDKQIFRVGFVLEENLSMTSAASVDDEMISFLQIKILLSMNHQPLQS